MLLLPRLLKLDQQRSNERLGTCLALPLRVALLFFVALALCGLATRELAAQEDKAVPAERVEELKEDIGNLLERLFGGPDLNQPAPNVPGVPNAQPAVLAPEDSSVKRTLDAVDRLAPVDVRMQEDWQKTLRRAKAGDWNAVMGAIDRLFDQGREDSLTILTDGSLVSIRHQAVRLLGEAPESVRESFARRNSATANQQLKEALAAHDEWQLARIATHYFWIDAGFEASDRLATLHLDRNEFGVAANWLRQLWQARAACTQDRLWLRRALLVARLSGDRVLEKELEAAFKKASPNGPAADAELAQLRNITLPKETGSEAIDDWPLFQGTARRQGVAMGSDPLSLARWRLPTTANATIRDCAERLLEFTTERGLPAIPNAVPLLVNGRVIYRSLDGIDVADAATGRLVWSLNDVGSVSAGLKKSVEFNGNSDSTNLRSLLIGNGSGGSGGLLGQVLYQNSAHGLLSSDGRRLYVVDDDPFMRLWLTTGRINLGAASNGQRQQLNSNILRALDLETGHNLWEVGGPDLHEDAALPLAGTYLLGAPVLDGDDLFVVGQQQTEIRLHVLNPATGEPKWSQLLGYSEQPIERDPLRRLWSVQVAVKGSVVVCPTMTGWLVGVDRTRRAVIWAQRYSQRGADAESEEQPNRMVFFGGDQALQAVDEAIGSRWAASAPIICRDRVLQTAIETSHSNDGEQAEDTDNAVDKKGSLICVDLYSGRRLWQRPRGSMQYVAGVVGDRIVLVGQASVKALSMNGKLDWSLPLPLTAGSISGRGVIVGESFYQPMQRGPLLKIDLKTGKLAATLKGDPRGRSLGNLAMYRGLLLSLRPGELSAFEQQTAMEERLVSIAQQPSRSVEDVLLLASVAVSRGQSKDALTLLKPEPREFSNRDLKRRYEDLLRECLIGVSQSDVPLDAEQQALLTRLTRTPAHRQQVLELELQSLVRAGDVSGAVRRVLATIRTSDVSDVSVSKSSQPQVSVSRGVWARMLLADLWLQLSEPDRTMLTGEIATLLEEVGRKPLGPEAERLAEALSTHSGAVSLAEQLAERAVREGNSFEELHWRNLIVRQATNNATRLDGVLKVARTLLKRGDVTAAEVLARKLENGSSEWSPTDQETLRKSVAQLRQDLPAHRPALTKPLGDVSVVLTRSSFNHSSSLTQAWDQKRRAENGLSGLRMLAQHENYNSALERISFLKIDDGSLHWTTPLRTHVDEDDEPQVSRAGGSLLVLNGRSLQALSVLDRRVLWSRPVERAEDELFDPSDSFVIDIDDDNDDFDGNSARPDKLLVAKKFLSRLSQERTQPKALAFANAEFVGHRSRQQLTVIETRTGDVRWSMSKLPPNAQLLATESLVVVRDPESGDLQSYRASDGRPVESLVKESELLGALLVDGDVVVSLVPPQKKTDKVVVSARDVRVNQRLWLHEFPPTTEFCLTGDDELVAYHAAGRVEFISLWTGEKIETPKLPPEYRLGRTDRFAFSDRERVYVVLNGKSDTQVYGEVYALPVSGQIVAFDRRNGQQLWTRTMSSFDLLLSDFVATPMLIGVSRIERAFDISAEVKLLVLNKATGEPLLEQVESLSDLSFRTATWDAKAQAVELLNNNQRLRLTIVPKATVKAETQK